jgi:putative tryptophan/tyrosine transport system substrate-binding protein
VGDAHDCGAEHAIAVSCVTRRHVVGLARVILEATVTRGSLQEFAEAGLLMSYGPDLLDLSRRAATYVDKILKGAKPAALPVEQPMTFDFVVNLKTAQALGFTFPNEIMLQATEVLE